MFDRFDRPVLVRLFLDEDRPGRRTPRFRVEVPFHRQEQTVGMLGRDAADVPVLNPARSGIHETHRKVLYAYIDRQ